MAEPGPGVHLDAGLETGGDHHQRVHSVPQHKVVIRSPQKKFNIQGGKKKGSVINQSIASLKPCRTVNYILLLVTFCRLLQVLFKIITHISQLIYMSG